MKQFIGLEDIFIFAGGWVGGGGGVFKGPTLGPLGKHKSQAPVPLRGRGNPPDPPGLTPLISNTGSYKQNRQYYNHVHAFKE